MLHRIMIKATDNQDQKGYGMRANYFFLSMVLWLLACSCFAQSAINSAPEGDDDSFDIRDDEPFVSEPQETQQSVNLKEDDDELFSIQKDRREAKYGFAFGLG